MPRKGWTSISLSDSLVEEVDQTIKKKPGKWNSRADFVTYAVRRLLEKLLMEA